VAPGDGEGCWEIGCVVVSPTVKLPLSVAVPLLWIQNV
jgi:hypothetical protein